MSGYRSEAVPDLQMVNDIQELIETRKTVVTIRNNALAMSKYNVNTLLEKHSGAKEAEAFMDDMKRVYAIAGYWFGKLDETLESERHSTEYGMYIPPCLNSIIEAGLEYMTPEEKDRALHDVKTEIENAVGDRLRVPYGLHMIQDILHKDHLERNREGRQ